VLDFVPRLKLYAEKIWINEGASDREAEVPVLALIFDYAGTRIRASDRRERFFVSQAQGVRMVERDRAGETRAQCLLESFGAVEIGCTDTYTPPFDSDADYIVNPSANVHAWCSFSAYAVPQLRALGWEIEIADDYPYRVASDEPSWYAGLEPAEYDEKEDWFSLELGVEIDGRRVNLLPALVELLDACPDSESLEQLMLLPARYRVLPIGEGVYLPVPPERLRSVLRVVVDLYRGERLESGALCLPKARATIVADLDAAFAATSGSLEWRGNAALFQHGRSLASAPKHSPAPTPGLSVGLRPYQAEGVAWLQHLREHGACGILADDMGLGKTLQTIAYLVLEHAAGRMREPTLVVVPKSLADNWERELGRFAPHLRVLALTGPKRAERFQELERADVAITTYPLLIRDLEAHAGKVYSTVILDEAQAIKNPRSLAHRAVKALNAEHRLCLTGTPVENHLGELWSLFDFLMPGFLGDSERFRNKYRNPIEKGGHQGALDSLRHVVAPFVLRRMKEHVVRELPPKTQIVRPIELEGDQRDLYESIRVAAHGEVRKVIKNKGVAGSTIAILDALMKLRQACCDPRLVSTPSARQVTASAKYETFFELLELQLAEGRQVLVFSQFARMLALLGQGLAERGIAYAELTGKTPDRQKEVDRFQGGSVDVFLISLKAGGTGLNLTRADTVVHYDPWWNSAAQAQATDRAHRIGQTRPVFVYDLIVAGSVEERMQRLQRKKAELSRTLLGSDAGPSGLSEADLDDLFAPLSE
jgi:superfamily II DNA or RNA helicase